mmetsp:Transcript_6729/g.10818  ORF Transcript_6729/g.10818 Transcript_6729/m.10818 type:complete len:108 (-) Transcript_6729:704-1027(-)
MLSGPIFGSFLYELGGFKLPFFVTGALLLALNVPITCLFQSDKEAAQQEAAAKEAEEQRAEIELREGKPVEQSASFPKLQASNSLSRKDSISSIMKSPVQMTPMESK